MDLSELQVFLTVAREGSFSRAAERLYPHPACGQLDHSQAGRRARPTAFCAWRATPCV